MARRHDINLLLLPAAVCCVRLTAGGLAEWYTDSIEVNNFISTLYFCNVCGRLMLLQSDRPRPFIGTIVSVVVTIGQGHERSLPRTLPYRSDHERIAGAGWVTCGCRRNEDHECLFKNRCSG
jgi:hypothetical protein